jgi:uncharacterized protein YacL
MGSYVTYMIAGLAVGGVIGIAVTLQWGYLEGKVVTILFATIGLFLGLALAAIVGAYP